MMTNIEELKLETERLLALLQQPEPGLFTWNEMLHKQIKAIQEFSPPTPVALPQLTSQETDCAKCYAAGLHRYSKQDCDCTQAKKDGL